jgi:uncharacterized protein Usg
MDGEEMRVKKTMLMYEADDWCELVVDGEKRGNHSIDYSWLADLPIEFPLTIISVYDEADDEFNMHEIINYFLEHNDIPSKLKEHKYTHYKEFTCEDWKEMLRNL